MPASQTALVRWRCAGRLIRAVSRLARFGFASFMEMSDFSKALKEMDGAYIGNRCDDDAAWFRIRGGCSPWLA